MPQSVPPVGEQKRGARRGWYGHGPNNITTPNGVQ
jgi:hypothetical protein